MLDGLLPADSLRPRWSTASALVYIGGFVALAATAALLGILGEQDGEAALLGYAALATGLALGVTFLLERANRAIAAGVAATLAVVFFAVLVGALLSLLGILDFDDDGYQPAVHVLEAAVIAAALLALRRFRAPLLVLVLAWTVWLTIVDLASAVFSWGDAEEAVSLAVGALLVVAGVVVDRIGREPYGFWLHAVGGVAIGGAVLSLVSGDAGWVLVGALSLLYVAAAYWLDRSSYAVLGAVGIVVTTGYFTFDPGLVTAFLPFGPGAEDDALEPWQIALSFVAAGLAIGALGLAGDRIAALRRR